MIFVQESWKVTCAGSKVLSVAQNYKPGYINLDLSLLFTSSELLA